MSRLILFLILASTLSCNSRLSADEIEAAVLVEFDSMVEAVKTLDSDTYFEFFYQNDFTAQFGGMTVDSFAEFKSIYESYSLEIRDYLSLEFPVVRVKVIGESSAILINEYSEVVLSVAGDTVRSSGSGSQVWKKSSLGWKLIHVTGSSD